MSTRSTARRMATSHRAAGPPAASGPRLRAAPVLVPAGAPPAGPDAAPPPLALADGTHAELRAGGLELRDGAGRLLVRYVDGTTEIHAPGRDLELVAPAGQVRIRAATDVAIEAARDFSQRAGRQLALGAAGGMQQLDLSPTGTRLHASKLAVDAKEARLATGTATLLARSVATTAERLAQSVDRYELRAERLVEVVRDAFRDATELAQSRAGRVRTLVAGTFSLTTRRSALRSTDDTSIDGRRVLLG